MTHQRALLIRKEVILVGARTTQKQIFPCYLLFFPELIKPIIVRAIPPTMNGMNKILQRISFCKIRIIKIQNKMFPQLFRNIAAFLFFLFEKLYPLIISKFLPQCFFVKVVNISAALTFNAD